jgi:P-type E1-E2 ATPase
VGLNFVYFGHFLFELSCLAFIDLEDNFDSENETIHINGYTCIIIVGIKDPVHLGVKEVVEVCRMAGITVRMVVGDNINTTREIATECGIFTYGFDCHYC